MKSLAVIHVIEEINASGFLPGVHLGYMLCDTCSYASKALQNVGHMLALNTSLNIQCDYIDFRPRVKIILGALYSEVSIAVARLLNVYMVPLVSPKCHTFYCKVFNKCTVCSHSWSFIQLSLEIQWHICFDIQGAFVKEILHTTYWDICLVPFFKGVWWSI